jgi:glycosyltransferase 2 family protein
VNKLLRFLVSAGLLAFLVLRLDWAPMKQAIAELRISWALAALGLFLLIPLVAALRWQLLARPLGFDHRFRRYAGIYYVGMLFNLILPTSVGGDVVRAWYLDGGQGRKMTALLCVLVDRATGLVVLIAMACCATLVQLDSLPTWVLVSVWSVAAAAAGGLIVLPWLGRLAERIGPAQRNARNGPRGWRYWAKRLASIPAGILDALRRYRGRERLVGVTCLLSLVIMAVNVVVVWMLGRSLGAQVPGAYYWVAVPVVTLLTLVPISVNGMGVREAGLGLLLAETGAPISLGVTIAVLLFGLYLAAGLVGAVVYLCGDFPTIATKAGEPCNGEAPAEVAAPAGAPRAA